MITKKLIFILLIVSISIGVYAQSGKNGFVPAKREVSNKQREHAPQRQMQRQHLQGSVGQQQQQKADKVPQQQVNTEKKKEILPVNYDRDALKDNSGKKQKENAGFTYIPITTFPYSNNNQLTTSSQCLTTLRVGSYAVGYSMNLLQGDYIDITLCTDVSPNGFDSYLYLLDSNYNIVAQKDDGYSCTNGNTGEQIQKRILATGTYYIIATSYWNGETGNFTLEVSKTSAAVKTYYVDALNGNNTNSGISAAAPLASLHAAVDSLNAEPSVGTVYIMSDVVLNSTLTINYFLTLKNHGATSHTISRNTATLGGHMIKVSSQAGLTLGEASQPHLLVLDGGSQTSFRAYGSIIYNEGTFVLYEGVVLQNNHNANYGGAVQNERTMQLHGGIITNNTANIGGGIYNNGTLTFHSGNITGNNSYNPERGSGIHNTRVFSMYGGTISGNTGKGIYNDYDFLLNGGAISDTIFLVKNAVVTLGNNYTHTQTKPMVLNTYYRGRQVLEGNLTANVIASFQLLQPDWTINPQGKLEFNGTPLAVYVDSLNGDNTNDGSLASPFKTLNHAVNYLKDSNTIGKIYLMSDILLSNSINISSDITLLPYGNNTYTIKRDTTTCRYQMIQAEISLTLGAENMTGGLILDGGYDTLNNPAPFIAGNSIIVIAGNATMYNGITLQNNNTGSNYGAALSVKSNGSFTMYGGEIKNNAASSGGGIYNYKGSVTMEGGEISHNTAQQSGGGIYNYYQSTFTMTDGTIQNNTAQQSGGGIYNYQSTFTMTDGTIQNNTAQNNGGGIYNYEQSTFTMIDGTIQNNTAQNNGGGIYNYYRSTFTMTDGTIQDNTAQQFGGGIYNSLSTFTMTDGTIQNNTAQNNGGGIYNYEQSTFTMIDGTIQNNTAQNNGGGIYNYQSTFTMTGGEISHNTASSSGSGIYNNSNGQIVLDGGIINPDNGIYLDGSSITLGDNYADMQIKTVDVNSYYKGRPVLEGNLTASTVGAFQMKELGWGIDDQGKLDRVAVVVDYYVDALNGNDANEGSLASPFQTLNHAVNKINDIDATGTVYIMSDLLVSNTIEIKTLLTILPYGNNTYAIMRDTTNCRGQMIDVIGSLALGNETMTGQLIFDGGYDTTGNPTPFIAGKSIINIYDGNVTMYNGITLQNNNTTGNRWGAALYLRGGSFTMYGGEIKNNAASSGGGIYNYKGSVIMEGGEISYNTVSDYGGGVYNENGDFLLNGGTISPDNGIYLDGSSSITLGDNYADMQTKAVDAYLYYEGKPILEGNLTTNTIGAFQMEKPDWEIDIQGKLTYTGIVTDYYVDAVNGDDTNNGSLASPFQTLNHAVEELNDVEAVGSVYIMSDLLVSNTIEITSYITVLPYGNNTYTIMRDTTNCRGQMIDVIGSLALGNDTMTGQLIFDGGYDTIGNPTPFIAGKSIINIYDGNVTMYNGITLQNNNTTGNRWGAALYLDGGSFTMYGGEIKNNAASDGGGIYNYEGSVTMEGGEISYNTVSDYGGGIYNYKAGFKMKGGEIKENTSSSDGGGICNDYTFFTMTGGIINNNTASYGGGIYNYDSELTMNGGEIKNNTASYGGGIYNNYDSELTITGGIINNNTASYGGGIYNYDSELTMEGGEIKNNTASYGGGIYNDYYSELTMKGGKIENNTASYGGGIYNDYDSKLTMKGGKIENNTASIGSGIFHSYGELFLQDSISFVGNDIATFDNGIGSISFVQMEDAIISAQPIVLSPVYYDNAQDTLLLDYTPCREMVRQGDNYTFKGEDLNLFALVGVTDTVLAFSFDNSSINIFQAPNAANDTTVSSCGIYTINGMEYTDSGIGYEYTMGTSCDSLVRRFIISVSPLMVDQVGEITGDSTLTTTGSYTYSVENIAGAAYSWTCSNSNWTISGSGASISLNVQSQGTATLTVQVIGDCDTAIRTLDITTTFTGIIETQHATSLQIYPNPTSGQLTIQWTVDNGQETMKHIEILDMYGRIVKQFSILHSQFSIEDLSSGVYLIKVKTSEGITTKKIIKQ